MSSEGGSVGVARSGADAPAFDGVRTWLTDVWITAARRRAGFEIHQAIAADGGVTVRVLGDLDLFSSPDLQAVLGALADARRPTVLDLSSTRFIDCSGLGIVLQAANSSRTNTWSFSLAGDRSRSVSRLIGLTNLDTALIP